MRITVNIPDAIYRRLDALAAADGSSVEQLLLREVESVIRHERESQTKNKASRLEEPILKGWRAGIALPRQRDDLQSRRFPMMQAMGKDISLGSTL